MITKEVGSLKRYLEENKITLLTFAKVLGVAVKELEGYISGELYPSREAMEKIFIVTEGRVLPMDFLFLDIYQKEFEIIVYINHCIELNIICQKELAYTLGISVSGVYRRLQGEYIFNENQIQKIMHLINQKTK